MDWHDRIIVDPSVLVGKPVIKGTRIAKERKHRGIFRSYLRAFSAWCAHHRAEEARIAGRSRLLQMAGRRCLV